ncbi:GNAT family N-acetyltransferase [Deinococcus sonorensis]|uniref:GNAT family N-acetyltransferase n=2 Tax=Deinococcus sonorensis TaxID=309891 RepID=A0AAU7U7F4_9DEIO
MPEWTVRAACAADAEALAPLVSAAYLGQWITTPEQLVARMDAAGPNHFVLVAEAEGAVQAGVLASGFPTAPAAVRLQWCGVPSASTPLYLAALSWVATSAPDVRQLISVVREDHADQVAFLTAAGFRNAHQSWGAHLALPDLDLTRYDALEERLYLAGYETERLAWPAPAADLASLYRLWEQGVQDAPRNPTTTPDPLSPETFRSQLQQEVVFLVRWKGQPVASTRLTPTGDSVDTEHTVVDRAHRGRGLATVVKAASLGWARAEGYTRASTGGSVANLPMLRVNQRLGYRPEPMWLTWVRPLDMTEQG